MATIDVTISAGQSLSNAATLGTKQPIALITPVNWTPAPIAFQLSPDGIDFYYVSQPSSDQVFTVPVVPSYWVPMDAKTFPNGIFLKILSGHPNQPIVQEADRVFKLVTT